MKLGIHMATKGDSVLLAETTFKTSNENTKTKAREIPMARFTPNPPRFFCDASASAKNVSIITENGIEVR